jgi:hypothetical protein
MGPCLRLAGTLEKVQKPVVSTIDNLGMNKDDD